MGIWRKVNSHFEYPGSDDFMAGPEHCVTGDAMNSQEQRLLLNRRQKCGPGTTRVVCIISLARYYTKQEGAMKTFKYYFETMMVLMLMLVFGGFIGKAFSATVMKCGAGMSDGPGQHSMAMHMVIPPMTQRTVAYTLPNVKMVREDGKQVQLRKELNDGRPVVLTFIFTTCKEICPVISATLAQLQHELGPDRDRVHLASISIDPEHDTPARLSAYAKEFGAGPEWHHYTGTYAASVKAQKAFDVYHGDKMDHTPVTFLRRSPGQKWIRIDGFTTADTLMKKLRRMLAKN